MKDSEDQRIKLASDLMNAREKIKRQEGNLNTINERLSMRDSENAFLKKVNFHTCKNSTKRKFNNTFTGSRNVKTRLEENKSTIF